MRSSSGDTPSAHEKSRERSETLPALRRSPHGSLDDRGAVGLLDVEDVLLVAQALVGQLLGTHALFHEVVVNPLGAVFGDASVPGLRTRLLVGMALNGIDAVPRAGLDLLGDIWVRSKSVGTG